MRTKAEARLERLPPTDWVGSGLLERSRRDFGPLYQGMLQVEEFAHPVRLWRARDRNGYACLAFSREDSGAGVLWPARDRRNADSPDYFGGVTLGGRRWRARAWVTDGGLSIWVKA